MTQAADLGQIDNQPGATYRVRVNENIKALATFHDGATAPDPVHPNMLWFDTGTGTVKIRNPTNTAWAIAGLIGPPFAWTATNQVDIKSFGAKGDGVTDDTAAVIAAVAACAASGADLFWPVGTYLTTDTIPSFWDVHHVGRGVVKRGTDLFWITPRGSETNIQYLGSAGLTANDGLSPAQATTISQAVDRFSKLGEKASAGIWRIQLQGTITSNGVKVKNWPAFANAVEFWGEAADLTSVPTAVWDGTGSTEPYAFRADTAAPNALVFIHFKNLKFTNWNTGTNSGAIVIWGPSNIRTDNCHADNCAIGFWYRHGVVRHYYGVINGATTFGVCVQYECGGNVGHLTGGGVTFTNCAVGVSVGRQSNCYIQGCSFHGMSAYCVEVSRNSRIRTQGNYFATFGIAAVYCNLNSVWTPDHGAGYPDTYGALSTAAPAVLQQHGGVHLEIDRGPQRSVHIVSDGTILSISGTTAKTVLSLTRPDLVPFRLPAYFLYSPTFKMEVEIGIALSAGAGGELALHGQSSSDVSKLASLSIAPVASYKRGIVRLIVWPSPGFSSGRYAAEFKVLGLYEEGTQSVNLNDVSLRDNTETEMHFRLYWTPATTAETEFFTMRTYVEG